MHPIEQLLFNENFQANSSPERFYSSNNPSTNVSSLAQNSIFSTAGVQPQQQPTQRSFGSFGVVGSNNSSTPPPFFPLANTSTNTSPAYAHYRSPTTLSSLGGNSFSPVHTSSPQQRKPQSNNPIFSQQRLPLFQQQSMNDTSEEANMDYNEEFIYNMGGMEDIDNSPTAVQALNQQSFPLPHYQQQQQQQQQQTAYPRSAMGGNQYVDYSAQQQQQNMYQANQQGSHRNGSYDSNLEMQFMYQQQMAAQQKYMQEMTAKSMAMSSKPQTIQQGQQQQQMYASPPSYAEGQGPYHQLRKEIVLGQNQPKNSFVEYSSPSSMGLNNFEVENDP